MEADGEAAEEPGGGVVLEGVLLGDYLEVHERVWNGDKLISMIKIYRTDATVFISTLLKFITKTRVILIINNNGLRILLEVHDPPDQELSDLQQPLL